MVPANSVRIPRVPTYSGFRFASPACAYGAVTLCGGDFQRLPLRELWQSRGPITPPLPKQRRFGLLPFRSPLLGESRLFSSPAGTKMFQFPAFACLAACRAFNAAGFPIRTPADQRSFAPTRGFSQLVASFIASWSLGIHHTPLFICSIRDFLIP